MRNRYCGKIAILFHSVIARSKAGADSSLCSEQAPQSPATPVDCFAYARNDRVGCRTAYLAQGTGFTLIEILLALAILGVGLVSILSLFFVSVNSAGRVLNLTRAGLIAQLTFEDIKYYGSINETNFTNISSGMNLDSVISPIPSAYSGLGFGRTLTVAVLPANTKTLNLTIQRGSEVDETFVTRIAKYAPQ